MAGCAYLQAYLSRKQGCKRNEPAPHGTSHPHETNKNCKKRHAVARRSAFSCLHPFLRLSRHLLTATFHVSCYRPGSTRCARLGSKQNESVLRTRSLAAARLFQHAWQSPAWTTAPHMVRVLTWHN